MRKLLATFLFGFFTLILSNTSALAKEPGHLFQVATYSALTRGAYDGKYTYHKLMKQGNFGVGTFQDLDGEMIALNGRFYQAESSGKKPGRLKRVTPKQTAPFAEVLFFKPFRESNITDAPSLSTLEEMIIERLPNKNIPYAIEIEGGFKSLTIRSLLKQTKPYRSAKKQAVTRLRGVSGSLVGFWFPKYWKGIAPAGLHLHFINSTHTIGGHVLEVSVGNGVFKSEPINNVHIYLPNTG